jgi:hypothetical protein
MAIEHKNPNDAPDDAPQDSTNQVLAALRTTTPPPGMETRIAQRLQREDALPAPARSRLQSLIPSAVWWRGAATGAAFATLALAALMLLRHTSSTQSPQIYPLATSEPSTTAPPSPATEVALSSSQRLPCAAPTLLPVRRPNSASIPRQLFLTAAAESAAPSHPAPALPLTPQERQLVRLVKTTDPAQLAALSPEKRAQEDARESAEFAKFFEPPPPLPSPYPDPESESAPTPTPQTNE